MSDDLTGIVKRLDQMVSAYAGLPYSQAVFHDAARAIESLLAEKARARDEALEECAVKLEREAGPPNKTGDKTYQYVARVLRGAADRIRALRSAKEQTDAAG